VISGHPYQHEHQKVGNYGTKLEQICNRHEHQKVSHQLLLPKDTWTNRKEGVKSKTFFFFIPLVNGFMMKER